MLGGAFDEDMMYQQAGATIFFPKRRLGEEDWKGFDSIVGGFFEEKMTGTAGNRFCFSSLHHLRPAFNLRLQIIGNYTQTPSLKFVLSGAANFRQLLKFFAGRLMLVE